MYLERAAEGRFARMLAGGKVVVVLGARQVGKTTLVEHALGARRTTWLNFDLSIDLRRFQAAASMSPADAARMLGSPEVLVVDEAQREPQVARVVKGWFDARAPFRVVLLGSSSLELLSHSAEALTGRNEKLRLPPLLFEETLQPQPWFGAGAPDERFRQVFDAPLRAYLLQAIAFGSYPEVVTTERRPELLRELCADYLWKDVLQLGLVRAPEAIRRLLMLLAHQVGSEVSVHELATQLGLARPTVERYLDLLEQTWVIFRLPSFSTNPRKEIAKGRKVFFWDTGIRNALLNAFSADPLRPDIGQLWEAWVVAEVAKRNLLEGGPAELFFWRSRSQSEVDLVVKSGVGLRAFEISWQRKRRGSRAFSDAYGIEVELLDAGDPFVGQRVFGPLALAHP